MVQVTKKFNGAIGSKLVGMKPNSALKNLSLGSTYIVMLIHTFSMQTEVYS